MARSKRPEQPTRPIRVEMFEADYKRLRVLSATLDLSYRETLGLALEALDQKPITPSQGA